MSQYLVNIKVYLKFSIRRHERQDDDALMVTVRRALLYINRTVAGTYNARLRQQSVN